MVSLSTELESVGIHTYTHTHTHKTTKENIVKYLGSEFWIIIAFVFNITYLIVYMI